MPALSVLSERNGMASQETLWNTWNGMLNTARYVHKITLALPSLWKALVSASCTDAPWTTNVHYNPYIGDGDSKSFKQIIKDKPYGPGFQHSKEECVGHVQKRMGTRLRREVEKSKGKL